ncbi:MAG: hypothetical protein ACXACR_16835, partial [Candidatus Hodarchaeales archaeon]
MFPYKNAVAFNFRIVRIFIFLSLIFLPLSSISGVNGYTNSENETRIEFSSDNPLESLKISLREENDYINDSDFDIESLLNYIDSLFVEEENIFLETIEGFATSIATFEALSLLRFLGMD